jgi:hypothetical protein
MNKPVVRSTVFFSRAFRLPSLDEVLPAGEYDLEIEADIPASRGGQSVRSVLIHLKMSAQSPGLRRTLTVPLAELRHALEADRHPELPVAEQLFDALLADPMVQLFMASDNVTPEDLRRAHFGTPTASEE